MSGVWIVDAIERRDLVRNCLSLAEVSDVGPLTEV